MNAPSGKGKPYEILTVKEAADLLRVHPYTVYDLLKTGFLTGFKVRRQWRIYSHSLRELMKTNRISQ